MRRTLEHALEALANPAGVVAESGEFLFANTGLRELLGMTPRERDCEIDVRRAFEVAGYSWSDTSMFRLFAGDLDPVVVHHKATFADGTFYGVASWLPPVVGWPKASLLTTHRQVKSEARAAEVHVRERLAVISAIQMDELRGEVRTAASMLNQALGRVDALSDSWVARLSVVENELPMD